MATVNSSGGRVNVTSPIEIGIRLAAANAATPPRNAAPESGPDAGVTAHSNKANPAARINPDAATATPRAAAAVTTSQVGST